MAKVVAYKEFSIKQGSLTDGDVPSCCIISGSSGFEYSYFRVECVVALAILDNDKVYFGVRSGWVWSQDPDLRKGYRWPSWFCHSTSPDSWVSGQWPEGRYKVWNDDCEGSTGDYGAYIKSSSTCNALTVGADSSTMSGWQYAATVEEMKDPDVENHLSYYFGIPMNNQGGEVSTHRADLTKISLEWEEIFDYFPWARYQTLEGESTYWSHNRKSPTTGSLQRISASKWTDVKNQMPEGTASNKDKGFRHNGTKFVKSPKEGKNK